MVKRSKNGLTILMGPQFFKCFKFVFLTKKFKENNYNATELFSKCNDQEHQNTQCYVIIEISKSMEPNKCTH